MVPRLPQLHRLLDVVGSTLAQEDRLQLYEAIAHVITAMPLQSAYQALLSMSFDLLSKIRESVALQESIIKEERKDVSGLALFVLQCYTQN